MSVLAKRSHRRLRFVTDRLGGMYEASRNRLLAEVGGTKTGPTGQWRNAGGWLDVGLGVKSCTPLEESKGKSETFG